MLDRVIGRSSTLRQQMISQSETKGERPMSNNDRNRNRNQDDDAELIHRIEDMGSSNARSIASEDHEVESSTMLVQDEAPIPESNDDRDDDDDFEPDPTPQTNYRMVEEEQMETQDPEDIRASSLTELFAGSSSLRLRIVPRIMLNVIRAPVDVPDVVRMEGEFYSVHSPMRKGTGTKDNPHGLVRDNLAQLSRFIGDVSARDVVFFGPKEDAEDRITELMDYIEYNAKSIMFSDFDNPLEPVFRVKQELPVEEEDEDEDEESIDDIGVTETSATTPVPTYVDVSANESFEVACWPVFDTDADETVVLRPTICINVKMPLLINSSSMVKPFGIIQKIITNYTKKAGLGEDDFRLTFAFDSEDLLDPSVLELLQHYSEDEDNSSVIIGHTYLAACANHLTNDPYRLFPLSHTAYEAAELMMPGSTDTLLLV